MDHDNCDHSNCAMSSANTSVCQTISEMDWERGLWYAAFNGDKDKVQQLINKSDNIDKYVNTQDNSGYTALHYAARNGHLDICKKLINYGAQVDAETRTGKATPLHKAAAAGHLGTVTYLIHSGANPMLQDIDGQTALHKAVEYKKCEVVGKLLEACPKLNTIKDNKGRCGIEY